MGNEAFIKQTAADYDIDADLVEHIYKKDPQSFYDNLENFIKERSQIEKKGCFEFPPNENVKQPV